MGMTLESQRRVVRWEPHPTKKRNLVARAANEARGLNEQDIDVIQEWCQENQCGLRTSFDTFRFKSDHDMTIFLLKWAK